MSTKTALTSPLSSPEFQLLISCVRNSVSEEQLNGIDWDRFEEISLRQKVYSLVHPALKQYKNSVPKHYWSRIEEYYNQNAIKLLSQQACIIEIEKLFSSQNIKFLIFKGHSLTKYYASPADRQVGDLDILILERDRMWNAIDSLLHSKKFTYLHSQMSSLDSSKKKMYSDISKDVSLVSRKFGIVIEVHSRFFPKERFWDKFSNEVVSNTSKYQLSNVSIGCINPSMQIAYLFIHGSLCGWFRIKWLIDIYYWASTSTSEEIEAVEQLCIYYNAHRAFLQAMVLLHVLFSYRCCDHIDYELKKNEVVRDLVDWSVIAIQSPVPKDRLSETLVSSVKYVFSYIFYQMKLRSDLRFKLDIIMERIGSDREWELLNYPVWISSFWIVLLPFTLSVRLFKRFIR